MGKSFRNINWVDPQSDPEFDASEPLSHIPVSVLAAIEEPADEMDAPSRYRTVPLSDARELFLRVEPQTEEDPEFGRYDAEAPGFIQAFWECVGRARGIRRTEVSRIALLRYERRGSAGITVSSLPTNMECAIDVELAGKAALSDLPKHFSVFLACYLDGRIAENRIPAVHRELIIERVGREIKKRGIYPLGQYFSVRVSDQALQKEKEFAAISREEREEKRKEKRLHRRKQQIKKRLKEKRAAARPVITTLQAAA